MNILTVILVYLVIGFGFALASLVTMLIQQIHYYIFKSKGKIDPVDQGTFGIFIIGWPLFLVVLIVCSIWALFDGSFKIYIDWLSSALGDDK